MYAIRRVAAEADFERHGFREVTTRHRPLDVEEVIAIERALAGSRRCA